MQAASTVFLVRPVQFSFNSETAESNHFQQPLAGLSKQALQQQAHVEFEQLVKTLRAKGIQVLVFDDTPEPYTPDSIFPNNWLTLHPDGRVLLYPMCAPNRRLERRTDILAVLGQSFAIREVVDFSGAEQEGRFLEGTGSILFDHVHKVAYACLSPRTDAGLFADVCAQLAYRPVTFQAVDVLGHAIYHTNVMMCIGDRFAVICLDSIRNEEERLAVLLRLTNSGKTIIEITLDQMNHFAGNMLQVSNSDGESLLVMSEQAFLSLSDEQVTTLEQFSRIIYAPIYTIEKNGGGSARCMLAEIHLPEK
jgi:hypothetical protein